MQICAYCGLQYGNILKEKRCPGCNAEADGLDYFHPVFVQDYVCYVMQDYFNDEYIFRFYKGTQQIKDIKISRDEHDRFQQEYPGISFLHYLVERIDDRQSRTHTHNSNGKQAITR